MSSSSEKPELRLWPVSPREILIEEFMKPYGLDAETLAERLNISSEYLGKFLDWRGVPGIGMTADLAMRLGKYFGNSPESWLNLQTNYNLHHVELLKADDPYTVKPHSSY